ncbi:hypothetical protein OBBRIDRAFT_376931 [Obba rivulosa]|uniref:F-box domain-containing protein n=1 Tax=Obba rivulosa TaxID=1052685 RepID=A0A8E2AQC3_9APHY|nr:hypothetical protein OBBRIDRAFT_376931 [Obba rivulosa]
MLILPSLNDDCSVTVLSHLDRRSLLSLAYTSRTALGAARPYLLRTVSLKRNAEQVREFCQSVLSHDLAGCIQDLRISRDALYPTGSDLSMDSDDDPQPSIFACALADVLEKSTNLKSLELAGLEKLIECEPRIGAALIAHPPAVSMELSGIGEEGFTTLSSVRSPPEISLEPAPLFNGRMIRDMHAGDHLAIFLTRNAEWLQDVVLHGSISRWLSTFLRHNPLSLPNVRTLTIYPFDIPLRQCAAAFPNVRCLSADWAEFDIPHGEVLWPDLLSVDGRSPLILYVARCYPNIRRIRLRDKYHPEPEDEFAELCDVMQQRTIKSLFLSVDYLPSSEDIDQNSIDWLVSRRISPKTFWPQLTHAVPQARFIEVQFRRPDPYTGIAADTLRLLMDSTIVSFGTVQDLKYVSFILRCFSYPPKPYHLDTTPSEHPHPTPREIASFWFAQCLPLEYVELNLQISGWERTWWRRRLSAEGSSTFCVVRVPEDEGLSARNRFDYEACQ